MKLDPLGDALQQVIDGATAASLEGETLDFKRDPHIVTGRGAPGNPPARLIEVVVDAVVCFANAHGGIVHGIDDRTPGPGAFIGTQADSAMLRNRVYGNTRPQLTVPIEEIEFNRTRLLVITVPEGLDLVTDSKGKALMRRGDICAPLTDDARRGLAHERRNPDLTARPSDRPWNAVSPAAMRQARSLLGQLVDLRSQMADLDDAGLLRALNLLDRDDRLVVAGEILFCAPEQDMLDMLTRPAAGAEPSVRRVREPLVLLLPHVLDSARATIDPEVAHVGLTGARRLRSQTSPRSRSMKP